MANLTDEQVAEFKVRIEFGSLRSFPSTGSNNEARTSRRKTGAAAEHRAGALSMVRRNGEASSISLLFSLFRHCFSSLRPGSRRLSLSLSLSRRALHSVRSLPPRAREVKALFAEKRTTSKKRHLFSQHRFFAHLRPVFSFTHSLYQTTGGVCPLRQGRRRDDHDERARDRHALAGPEPDGGGASGARLNG